MSTSSTPGRRSTRERRSPRNPSPMSTRGPRASGLSNVETIQPEDATDNDAHPRTTTGDFGRSEDAVAHGMNNTNGPATTSQKIPKLFMRFKAAETTPTPAAAATRDSSKARKSGRMSEVTKREQQPSSGGGHDEEDLAKGSGRLEESGDDDYKPGYKPKGKRSKKSLDPVVNVNGGRPESIVPAQPSRAAEHQATVESAIRVARNRDNQVLAITLKLIYQLALEDESLAVLLEATLLQTSTQEEANQFQGIVKNMRKRARELIDTGLIASDFQISSVPLKFSSELRNLPPKMAAVPEPVQAPAKRKYTKRQPAEVQPAPAAAVSRGRGGRKQYASPVPTKQTPQYLEPPQHAEPAMTTRNGKKRTSTTPEPSTLRTNEPAVSGEDERPRKRARRSSPNAQNNNVTIMQDSSELSDSDLSELPDLGNSSPEPPPDMLGGSSFGGKDRLATTVHGFRIGGRQLKRQPEPGQKVKTSAANKHGIGLPDEAMRAEKERYAREQNRSGPEPIYSELRDEHHPSRAPRTAFDADGVFTPSAREQIERQRAQSPATSSVQGDLLIAPPPGYAKPTSRASTPVVLGRGSVRLQKRGHIIISPRKRTIAGGIGSSFGIGGSNSPVGEKADGESNLDFCVTCGDGGELICCDGCPRAFHLICCDPPFNSDNPPPAADSTWLCAVCDDKRKAAVKPEKQRMVFATLLRDVQRHNPTKFALPKPLQTHFEGVKVNDEGAYEYDEGVQAKHRTRASGPAAEAEIDPFKVKDSRGNFVLCFHCGLSAAGKREIIKCDYCGLHWHLDCLDPPPANPPVRQPLDGRPRPLWRCPAHATNDKAGYGETRSIHKIRRPRNAKIMDTLLSRGLKNNGNIEIENDPSDIEDDTDMYNDDGSIYRVTEKSVKLDFIERINRERETRDEEERRRTEEAARLLDAQRQANFDFNMRSFVDQRAALSLLELNQELGQQNGQHVASLTSDDALSKDKLQSLIHGLVAEAPSEVLALLADAPPKRPSANGFVLASTNGITNGVNSAIKNRKPLGTYDRRSLLMLRDMLSKRLDETAEEMDSIDQSVNGVS